MRLHHGDTEGTENAAWPMAGTKGQDHLTAREPCRKNQKEHLRCTEQGSLGWMRERVESAMVNQKWV